jgi:methionyl aminopeptidase
VGEVSRRAERLIEITYEAMMRGIAAVRPGATTNAIGAAIQSYAEGEHCSSCATSAATASAASSTTPRTSCTTEPGDGVPLKAGMLFTVEPMINLGRPAREGARRRLDGGHARPLALGPVRAHGRRDRDGVEIFTLSPKGSTSRPTGG